MKNISVLVAILFTVFSFSQNKEKTETLKDTIKKEVIEKIVKVKEPEWIGQAVHVENEKTTDLESKTAYMKANASAGLLIVGYGKVNSKWVVKGNKSNVRIKSNNNIKFIVNAGANNLNPKSVIKIVKLLTNKKNKRYYVSGSSGTFTGTKIGDLEVVSFRAKKYGKSSYEIMIPNISDGEYALIINDSAEWNLFGIGK